MIRLRAKCDMFALHALVGKLGFAIVTERS